MTTFANVIHARPLGKPGMPNAAKRGITPSVNTAESQQNNCLTWSLPSVIATGTTIATANFANWVTPLRKF